MPADPIGTDDQTNAIVSPQERETNPRTPRAANTQTTAVTHQPEISWGDRIESAVNSKCGATLITGCIIGSTSGAVISVANWSKNICKPEILQVTAVAATHASPIAIMGSVVCCLFATGSAALLYQAKQKNNTVASNSVISTQPDLADDVFERESLNSISVQPTRYGTLTIQ